MSFLYESQELEYRRAIFSKQNCKHPVRWPWISSKYQIYLCSTEHPTVFMYLNNYISVKYNNFLFSKDYMFTPKIPSSGHHYKNSKIRYSILQIMLVIWDPLWLTKVTQYKIYIKLYKNYWIGNVLAGFYTYKNLYFNYSNNFSTYI